MNQKTNPQWIWESQAAMDVQPRLIRVVFKREITLQEPLPKSAVIHLTACCDYKLSVNGEIVNSGPGRASQDHWEYDSHELAPLLKTGANLIEVEARHYTIGTYHHNPMPPGFIAWGEIANECLATPGAWKSRRRNGVDASAPRLSFAQAPVDFVDLREDASGAWTDPVLAPHCEMRPHPGAVFNLHPRAIPHLTRMPLAPASVKVSKAETDGDIIGNRSVEIDDKQDGSGRPKVLAPFACRIWSPSDQTVNAGCWWGEYKLNGVDAKLTPDDTHQMWQLLELPLKAGWNHLDMTQGQVFGFAENCIALPKDKGLKVDVPILQIPFTPVRHVLWSSPLDYKSAAPGAEIICPAGEKTLVTVDMGGITLAVPRIEIDAPPGTVLDITHAEECDAQGRPWVGKAVVVYAGDRFILPGGNTTLETFGPRGFRYLDILVSGNNTPVRIRSIGAMERRYPFVNEASFECSDPDFNNLWKWSVRTFELCSEDVFVDCPWRERTLYGGDMLAEGVMNAIVTRDLRLTKRCLEVFMQAAGDNSGWPPGRAPVPRREGGGGEYALLTAISTGWYLRATGDAEFARRWWPAFKRMAATAERMKRADGIYQAGCFIDHGKLVRHGALCAFNAAMRGAYREWAVIAEMAGEPAEAARMRAAGDALDAAIVKAYLDPAARCFRDHPLSDGGSPAEGSPANAWALLFCDGARKELPGVLAELADNMSKYTDETQHLSCSPYQSFFLLYALSVAGGNGATALAEDSIRKIFATMLKRPTGTLWEMGDPNASCTHAWSCGPGVWFAIGTLGVGLGLNDPEELRKVIVKPRSATLAWARGKVRHPLGLVEVEWKRKPDGKLDIKAKAPEGVEVVIVE